MVVARTDKAVEMFPIPIPIPIPPSQSFHLPPGTEEMMARKERQKKSE